MTNEEAIKRIEELKNLCELLALKGNLEEWRKDAEACDIAISALQSVGKDITKRIGQEKWVSVEERSPEPDSGPYWIAKKKGNMEGLGLYKNRKCLSLDAVARSSVRAGKAVEGVRA